MKPVFLLSFALIFLSSIAFAELRTSSIIGENMVLQQKHKNPIWGWAEAGETVTVSIAGQSHKAKADKKGYWKVVLDPMDASAKPKTLSIKGKSSSLSYPNVLIGEVWVCSGQSNMGFSLGGTDDSDL
jgi:sialate O-acetylesterase